MFFSKIATSTTKLLLCMIMLYNSVITAHINEINYRVSSRIYFDLIGSGSDVHRVSKQNWLAIAYYALITREKFLGRKENRREYM